MIENLQSINIFTPSLFEILINFLVSFICSYVVSLIYRYTYRGVGYSQGFVNSIVSLSLITTMVIMIIGNNLARAFGLVGALSIIRFRTAIKDASDIVYIFLSLALGMCAGVGYHKLAFAGTIILGIILIVFSKVSGIILQSERYLLQFIITGEAPKDPPPFIAPMDKFCSQYEIMNIRTDDINEAMVYSYHVRLKRTSEADKFIDELKSVSGIRNVNFFFDQQSI